MKYMRLVYFYAVNPEWIYSCFMIYYCFSNTEFQIIKKDNVLSLILGAFMVRR